MLAPAAAQPEMRAKPSAIAALREFFTLSPMWMKAATAFASILFCVCAVLAIGYMKGRQPATAKNDKVYSEKEFQVRLAAELQNRRIETPPPSGSGLSSAENHPQKNKMAKRPVISPGSEDAKVRNPRRPFTRQERQELATDLRLVSSKDDDDLDLTTDSNRPAP